MIKDLLIKVLGLETQQATALKETIKVLEGNIADLHAKIETLNAQDVIDKANADDLAAIEKTLTERLAELQSVNPTPVTDALADVVDEAPGDTPEAITSDAAINSPEVTSDEAVEAIAEAIPAIEEAESEA